LELWCDHLGELPLGQEPHLMECIHRERKLMHQSRRNFVLYVYVPVNTFHHNSRKVLACDVPPFLLEIPFGSSRFVSERGEP
jgi:hypothetical protein